MRAGPTTATGPLPRHRYTGKPGSSSSPLTAATNETAGYRIQGSLPGGSDTTIPGGSRPYGYQLPVRLCFLVLMNDSATQPAQSPLSMWK